MSATKRFSELSFAQQRLIRLVDAVSGVERDATSRAILEEMLARHGLVWSDFEHLTTTSLAHCYAALEVEERGRYMSDDELAQVKMPPVPAGTTPQTEEQMVAALKASIAQGPKR
jgi:hypothetical protein